jgi:hypothetical protein
MHRMVERFAGGTSTEFALLTTLPIVLLNFMIIGAYRGWRKGFVAKAPKKKKKK